MNKYLAGVELVLKNGETKDIVYVIPNSTDEWSAKDMLLELTRCVGVKEIRLMI